MFGKSIVAFLFLLQLVHCRPQNQNAAAGQQQAAGGAAAGGQQGQCGAHPWGGANNPMFAQIRNCFSETPCAKRDQCRSALEGIMTNQATINQVIAQLQKLLDAPADQPALDCFKKALSDASSGPVNFLKCLAENLAGQQQQATSINNINNLITTLSAQSGDELASKKCEDIASVMMGLSNAQPAIVKCMHEQFNNQNGADQSNNNAGGANSQMQMHSGGQQPANAQDHCTKMQSWIQSRIQCLHQQHQSAGQCTDNNTGAAAAGNANPAPASQSG